MITKIRIWIAMWVYDIAGHNKGDKFWVNIPKWKKFCWWLASKIIK